MSKSLYELTQEQLTMDDRLDDILENVPEHMQAELLQEFFDETLKREGTMNQKLDGYAYLIRRLESEADAAEIERELWAAKAKSRRTKVTWLKSMLKYFLEVTKQISYATGKFKIRLQNNGGVVPVQITGVVPVEYMRQPPPVPDIEKIRYALEAGIDVPGAMLGERGKHVRIG